jgi:O-antigen/teichoic acid export membrane protein
MLLNTAATGLSNMWTIVATLVALPILLHGLGAATFGRWVLLQTLSASTGWLVVLDVGLGTSVTTAVARGAATGDVEDEGRTIGTGLAMFGGVAAVGALITAVAGWPIFRYLARIPAVAHHDARLAVWLLTAQVAAELVTQGSQACLEGLQRVDLSRSVDVALRTMFAGGTAIAAIMSHRLAMVELAAVVATCLAAVLAGAVLWAHGRGLHLRVSRPQLRRIAVYAGVLGLLRPISALFHLMNRVIVGIVLGPAAVALVEVATQLQNGVSAVLSTASYTVLPGSAWLEARGDATAIRRLVVDGTRYVLLVTLPVAIGVAILARPGIELWVGANFRGAAGPAAIAALSMGIAAVGMPGANVLMGTGRAAVCVRAESAAIVVNLAASILLVHAVGVPGVFWGTACGYAVTTPWFLRAAGRQVGVRPLSLVASVARRLAGPVLGELVAVELVVHLGLPALPTVALAALAGGGAFIAGALRLAVEPGEVRELLQSVIRRPGPTPPLPPHEPPRPGPEERDAPL